MKIIFACREGLAGCYIGTRLNQEGLLQSIIIESGNSARRRKIDRILKQTKFWQLPVVFLQQGEIIEHLFLSHPEKDHQFLIVFDCVKSLMILWKYTYF